MPCSVALAQSGTISVYTLPPRLKIPKTGVFLYAPRPRLSLLFYRRNRIHRLQFLPGLEIVVHKIRRFVFRLGLYIC